MGMFDYVNYEMGCPECGSKVSDFQSKDGMCILGELEYWEVDNFYSQCKNCHLWIDFSRETPKEKVPIENFTMATSKRGGKS